VTGGWLLTRVLRGFGVSPWAAARVAGVGVWFVWTMVVGVAFVADAGESAMSSSVAKRLTAPARSVSVIMGGDVLNESAVNIAGAAAAPEGVRFNFAPVFAGVAPIIRSADLAICHAELPIGRPDDRPGVYGRSPFGGNLLLAPFELAAGLDDAGFDRCSTASNHSFDLGATGIASTLEALDAAGIHHTGTARSPEEASDEIVVVAGVRVAHLAYTRASNTVPPSDGWMLDRAETVEQVAGDVARVRQAGAEIVIVSLHLGQEMQRAPSDVDRAFATQLTASARVDLVVHHGPHVIQPVERVNGTIVYWSVGNFISGMGRPGTGRYADPRTLDGLLASVRFTETSPGVFDAEAWTVLICNELGSRTIHAPISELADAARADSLSPQQRAQLQACIDRTTVIEPDIH
jgi:poly-gamma-glutamate capsule biosynthesis protein CapA/YwtB (metallophosphatase superfamily)